MASHSRSPSNVPRLDLSRPKEIQQGDVLQGEASEPAGVHSSAADQEETPQVPQLQKSPRREYAKSARARQKAEEHYGASQLTCRKCGKSMPVRVEGAIAHGAPEILLQVMCRREDAEVARYKAKQIGFEQGGLLCITLT